MAYNFNADEVLRLAEKIERNGADFYARLAEKASGLDLRRFFSELVSMEREHEKFFATMRSKLSEGERESLTFDPENESTQYLEALAGVSIVDDKASKAFALAEGLSGSEGLQNALRAAIDLEKDSVVFYLALKGLVPANLGREQVDGIIQEEMKHIRLLGARLASLKG